MSKRPCSVCDNINNNNSSRHVDKCITTGRKKKSERDKQQIVNQCFDPRVIAVGCSHVSLSDRRALPIFAFIFFFFFFSSDNTFLNLFTSMTLASMEENFNFMRRSGTHTHTQTLAGRYFANFPWKKADAVAAASQRGKN